MSDLLKLVWCAVVGLFRTKASLEAEILILRHQLNVVRRKSPRRHVLSNIDRLIFVGLYHFAPRILDALAIIKPETVIRWHRLGFRLFWRWKSRSRETTACRRTATTGSVNGRSGLASTAGPGGAHAPAGGDGGSNAARRTLTVNWQLPTTVDPDPFPQRCGFSILHMFQCAAAGRPVSAALHHCRPPAST